MAGIFYERGWEVGKENIQITGQYLIEKDKCDVPRIAPQNCPELNYPRKHYLRNLLRVI